MSVLVLLTLNKPSIDSCELEGPLNAGDDGNAYKQNCIPEISVRPSMKTAPEKIVKTRVGSHHRLPTMRETQGRFMQSLDERMQPVGAMTFSLTINSVILQRNGSIQCQTTHPGAKQRRRGFPFARRIETRPTGTADFVAGQARSNSFA